MPAPKAPATPAAGAADDGAISRRGFFSWAAVAWVGFTVAIGGCVTTFGRFMFPNVLYEPPTSFKVGKPEDFPRGVVDTRFTDQFGVWIVNNEGKIYALIAICTHLGCPPAWLEAQNKFKCPCHGSGYYKSGVNFEGPTPRPLERARITVSPDDGQILVDKAQKYQWELGQWEDPNSYIAA
jgi:cytochrome b6-f complex iron-sulfur subunit